MINRLYGSKIRNERNLYYKILNIDNMTFETNQKFDIIFNDFGLYENLTSFCWAKKYFQYLKPNSIFITMTDFHSQHRSQTYMEDEVGAIFVNHLVWRNQWGTIRRINFIKFKMRLLFIVTEKIGNSIQKKIRNCKRPKFWIRESISHAFFRPGLEAEAIFGATKKSTQVVTNIGSKNQAWQGIKNEA